MCVEGLKHTNSEHFWSILRSHDSPGLTTQVQAHSERLLPDARLAIGILDLPLLLAVTWAFRSWAKAERQMLKNIRRRAPPGVSRVRGP